MKIQEQSNLSLKQLIATGSIDYFELSSLADICLSDALIQSSFEKIGKDTLNTSKSLGANPLDTFFNIIIPLCKRGFLTSFIISFAHTMGEFGIVLMVGGGIHGKTKVIAISIYDHVEQLSFGKAHFLAGGMLFLSFIILLTLYYSNKQAAVRVK